MDSVPAETWLVSPCVGVCRLDPDTGWCVGCGRDGDELNGWRGLDSAARGRVWRDLPRRTAIMGGRFRLLPWAGAALIRGLAEMAAVPGAGWSVGVYGAIAELAAAPGERIVVQASDQILTLRTPGGRLRLTGHPGLRAFELVSGSGQVERIVLALHRSRLAHPPMGITELGPDVDAIELSVREDRLFDLGLGFSPVRFCVRTVDPDALQALRLHAGGSILEPGNALLPLMLAVSPERVVFSPVARLEIEGAILRHGHDGPHTHLLPDLLAQKRELEPGSELPEAYAPCASFYPARSCVSGN